MSDVDAALGDAAEIYLRRKTVGDSGGPETGGTYAAKAELILERFVDWLEREHGVRSVSALETEHMRSYARELRDRADRGEYAPATAGTYYAVVRAFLSWCARSDIIAANPAASDRATEPLPSAESRSDREWEWTAEQRRRLEAYVRDRALAVDRERGSDREDRRDRLREYAMVAVLAHSGARGSELFRVPQDDRRTGATWDDVDFYTGTIRVLGRSQQLEDVSLLAPARTPLRRYRVALDPPSNDWPLFPTRHAPSIASRVRSTLRDRGYDDEEIEALLEERTATELARERSIAPPAITTEGARSVLKRLCSAAGIDVDGEYLTPRVVRDDTVVDRSRRETVPAGADAGSVSMLERSTAVPETETRPVVLESPAGRTDPQSRADGSSDGD
ncbi:tyrosine-type recombinase/integrase [Halopiger xanaduensis]|uniref:Integrase domain protein SAM domain protein n=1 Tax=Halopiger xanaduensis (strain DSM 18323 / JCM 14033 / SH-6) TaxID=797210 RepID=F8D9Q8_HALXS|nr:site-specific integrase [Halopiger xanaduensis]AEH37632.1 integrase domain protein SAM domain protein [Halopiger xanaduensis SH-6]